MDIESIAKSADGAKLAEKEDEEPETQTTHEMTEN